MGENGSVLREVVARIGLDFDGEAFEKAEHGISSLKGAFLAVGAVIGAVKGALAAATYETVQSAIKAEVAANRLGITTQAYQELGAAAEMADISQESLAHAMLFLSRSADQAKQGSKEMTDAFSRLGVSVTDASGKLKPTDQLLTEAADKFSGIKSPAEKAALAMTIFGRGGAEIIPLLNRGGAAIDEYRKMAVELGVVMSEDFMEQAKAFDENIKILKMAATGLRNAIAETMIPSMLKTVEAIRKWVVANRELIKNGVVKFVRMVAEGIEGMVTALSNLVSWWYHAFDGMEGFRTALIGIIGLLGVLAAVTMSPVIALGLLVGLLLAIGQDYANYQNGIPSVIGDVMDGWEKFVAAVREEPNFTWLKVLGETLEGIARTLRLIVQTIRGDGIKDLMEQLDEVQGKAPAGSFEQSPKPEGFGHRLFTGLFGSAPGATPLGSPATIAGAPPASIAMPFSPTINTVINVTAAPGQSTREVAGTVADKVQDVNDANNRKMRGMLPAGATP